MKSRALLAALVLVFAACGDAGPESGPGTLTATLVTPNGAEGSAVLSMIGAGVGAVRAVDGWVFSEASGDTTRVVVVAEDPGVLRFLVEVADTTVKPTAVVLQVAGPDDALRTTLVGYEVELRR